MNVLVVYCHPDPTSFTAAVRDRAVETLDVGRARRASPTSTPRASTRVHGAEDRTPRSSRASHPTLHDHADRPAVVRAAGARLPDVVERAAGDAQGLDRPGVGRAAWRGTCPPAPTACTPALRNVGGIVAITTHGSSKLVNALRGRGRQAHRDPHAAGGVPPPGAHDVDRDVRHRHLDAGGARRLPRDVCRKKLSRC